MLVDPETIQKAQEGDDDAYNDIVRLYRRRILGTVYRLIGRTEDVEDVAQDVFVRLYYSLKQLREPGVFEPWLYKLTTNAAYDYLRKRRRAASHVRMADMSEEQMVVADAAESGRRASDERKQTEVRELLDALFVEVKDEDRVLLTLKEIEGLTLKELAEIYDVNENALKVRLFRARQRVLKAHEKLKKRGAV
jgi:RNA polymerase sigma-70 factor (ECF subfamily)